ncbi:MAG: ABC transporter permease [Rhodospirillaceae bacterium]|nr:ABC transporter permease [Rhodospirillaceae bacterium]MCY4066547.1 ABC transporter permease [Rhodospirillaceae bacterium]MDE0702938.1 ABC transporter permease [Rhodospirillaceae bacterium]MXW93702.1 ABC transporter permease [Rhodospirillaceae bacterium]MYB14323.1 ABC transporter permease [Rhodospirillaceae bacterium]
MSAFLIRRAMQSLAVIAIMSFLVYALIGLMPGDPIDIMISSDPKLTPADAARLRALYGLDLPIGERYWNWLSAALGGDLGFSRSHNRPVLEVMGPHLLRTLLLMGLSFVISVAIAIPLGVWAAARPYSVRDYAVNLFSFAGRSAPPFWLALILIFVFAVWLGWLPAGGLETIGKGGFWDRLQYLVLPVLSLTLLNVAGFARFVRAETMAVMRQDFIRTARAKGLNERSVLLGHALRNAMIPIVTIVALDFGTLFSGALITETVFAYPGMGKMIFDSILANDFNLALVGLLFATFVTLAANLGADVAYAVLDPRIALQ